MLEINNYSIILSLKTNIERSVKSKMEHETNFRKMRRMLGLKQNEIASKVGVSPTAVNLLERKGRFDTRTACKYAAAMNCNPIFLLDGLTFTQSPTKTVTP